MGVTLFELEVSEKTDLLNVRKALGFVTNKAWLLHHIAQDKAQLATNAMTMEGENQC